MPSSGPPRERTLWYRQSLGGVWGAGSRRGPGECETFLNGLGETGKEITSTTDYLDEDERDSVPVRVEERGSRTRKRDGLRRGTRVQVS